MFHLCAQVLSVQTRSQELKDQINFANSVWLPVYGVLTDCGTSQPVLWHLGIAGGSLALVTELLWWGLWQFLQLWLGRTLSWQRNAFPWLVLTLPVVFCRGSVWQLPLGLLRLRPHHLHHHDQPDPQVVPHLLWPSPLGRVPAGLAHHPAQETPQDPPRVPTRDLLLHHHGYCPLNSQSCPQLCSHSPWKNCNQGGFCIKSVRECWWWAAGSLREQSVLLRSDCVGSWWAQATNGVCSLKLLFLQKSRVSAAALGCSFLKARLLHCQHPLILSQRSGEVCRKL